MAGDLNIRKEEESELPCGTCLSDVYSQLRCPKKCRYTWEPSKNVNIEDWIDEENIQKKLWPRDRCQRPLEPERMELVGREKLPSGRHVSDHWGVMVRFKWGY
ncbi:unnamed protein product [Vitrella brassicaformis CCMP3155]|uniref:Endonuclease/exonuclease/phosphatase domain-containing protein n=1 Tax=Vitrella brassicaformis (strain CCMP3155) TaxID=1169540 RepID=A0A0G4GJW6_VITBC|nr:unnamed protein product [Vitrella brassicaformis CCMP3155]|eukprot:CEM30198.1 unnamed protein product [Vitrella brassicaformis CCMP3155]